MLGREYTANVNLSSISLSVRLHRVLEGLVAGFSPRYDGFDSRTVRWEEVREACAEDAGRIVYAAGCVYGFPFGL